MTVLPVNIDTTYPDDPARADVQLHQYHHDVIHARLNGLAAEIAAQISAHNVAVAHGAVAGTSKIPIMYTPSGLGFEIFVGLTSAAPFPTATQPGALFFRPS